KPTKDTKSHEGRWLRRRSRLAALGGTLRLRSAQAREAPVPTQAYGELGLLAHDQRHKTVRQNRTARMRIIRGCRWRWSELRRHYEDVVGLSVERHGARALLCGDIL